VSEITAVNTVAVLATTLGLFVKVMTFKDNVLLCVLKVIACLIVYHAVGLTVA